MCTQDRFGDLPSPRFDRRQFAVLSGSAALAACTGMDTGSAGSTASGLTESSVTVQTGDGMADAFFVHPARGRHPGVIFWPDIAGLRDAKRMMARRLAEAGYAVLVVNPYYRDVAGEQFEDFAAFRADNGFAKVKPWRDKLTAQAIGSDAKALVAWLDSQSAVDTSRPVGTQGYCMGGPFTFWSAAAVPGRIEAAASFHGGGLVRDSADSPHRTMDDARASYLIAIAQDDDAENPDHKDVLRRAAAEAGRTAEVEVYAGDHGWTVPDSPAYDRPAAEKAWSRLLAVYGAALA